MRKIGEEYGGEGHIYKKKQIRNKPSNLPCNQTPVQQSNDHKST